MTGDSLLAVCHVSDVGVKFIVHLQVREYVVDRLRKQRTIHFGTGQEVTQIQTHVKATVARYRHDGGVWAHRLGCCSHDVGIVQSGSGKDERAAKAWHREGLRVSRLCG